MSNSPYEKVQELFANPHPEDTNWLRTTLSAILRAGIADAREFNLTCEEIEWTMSRHIRALEVIQFGYERFVQEQGNSSSVHDLVIRTTREFELVKSEIAIATEMEKGLLEADQFEVERVEGVAPESITSDERKAVRREEAMKNIGRLIPDLDAAVSQSVASNYVDSLHQEPNIPASNTLQVARDYLQEPGR